jgi:hypothetical protein
LPKQHGIEHTKMAIGSNDVIRLCSDRAINKLVVISVGCDDAKSELGFHKTNVGVEVQQQRQKLLNLLPACCTRKSHDRFLILKNDLVGDRQLDFSAQECITDRPPHLVSPEELKEHIRVEANTHQR